MGDAAANSGAILTDRSGMADANGIEIHYAIYGQGSPVIFLHGGLANTLLRRAIRMDIGRIDEIEAWAVGEKGYKIGSITKRITNCSPEIKEAFMALMKRAAVEAMLDLLGENGVVGWSSCNG